MFSALDFGISTAESTSKYIGQDTFRSQVMLWISIKAGSHWLFTRTRRDNPRPGAIPQLLPASRDFVTPVQEPVLPALDGFPQYSIDNWSNAIVCRGD